MNFLTPIVTVGTTAACAFAGFVIAAGVSAGGGYIKLPDPKAVIFGTVTGAAIGAVYLSGMVNDAIEHIHFDVHWG